MDAFLPLNPIELSSTISTSSSKCRARVNPQTPEFNHPKTLLSNISTISCVFIGFSQIGFVERLPAKFEILYSEF